MNSTFEYVYSELEKNWDILTDDNYRYDLPLTRSPLPSLLIIVAYLLFVLRIGPTFMKSRSPINVKWIMLAYNALQIVINFYTTCSLLYIFIWERPFNLSCITILSPQHPLKLRELYLSYTFYLLKFFDLFDTVFFILRKKLNQVTFLHVYHHFITSALGVVYIKLVGLGGHALVFACANTLVHSFMYSYYFLSSINPKLRGTLWWKRYVTKVQIIQFFVLVTHNAWPLLFKHDCQHPKWLLVVAVTQFSLMIVLFTSFYKRTYLTKFTKDSSIKDPKGNPNLAMVHDKFD